MKVLIAYDGSGSSEAAIDDLGRAGLRPNGTAKILSIAEVCLPQPDSVDVLKSNVSPVAVEIAAAFRKSGERSAIEASMLARHAEARVRRVLPDWNVSYASTYGSPAREILDTAERMQPDLIVLGSHGQSTFSRYFLGSISQKVLTEALCSVRIARGKIDVDSETTRVIVGFDGSDGALYALHSAAERNWGSGTEIRVVIASEPTMPNSIGRFVPPICSINEEVNISNRQLFEQLGQKALEILRGSGVNATFRLRPGSPKSVLVEEAERWGADCIFVGASSGGSEIQRMLLGSTSSAIAARAFCSVEVVRYRSRRPIVRESAAGPQTNGTNSSDIGP
jgi:nucleotide-binding universal stress UspA family protein